MVFSGIAIGFMGWGVWVHHMFSVGLRPVAVSAFSVSTMFIAVPTGVKIFNWLGTMYGGSLRFKTPMLFAIGFIAMFTIGGLSGVTHSLSPHDRQQTDTYYIVAHFHYVLFGGSLFAIFGGMYYWWPKAFGYTLSDAIGKWQFWLMFIGFNLTFGPMLMLHHENGNGSAATAATAAADGHGDGPGEGHDGHDGHEEHKEHKEHIHLPSPSFYPMIAASGLPVIAYGVLYGRGGAQAYLVS